VVGLQNPMRAIAGKNEEREYPSPAKEELHPSPTVTLAPRPQSDELLGAVDLGDLPGLARAHVDSLIVAALGEENLAFLKTKAHDEGITGSDLAHILITATRMTNEAERQYALRGLHESYRTILDFDARLGEPRAHRPDREKRTVNAITVPRGDSVQLLRSSIQHLADTIETRAEILSSVRDEIAQTRATVAEDPPVVPVVVDVQAATPVAIPPADTKKPPFTKTIAADLKRLFGSLTINLSPAAKLLGGALQLIAPLLQCAQQIMEETKEAARGNTILKSTIAKLSGSLRPLIEFSIRGQLEGLAHQALGTLSPRSALARYAQTGSSQPSGETPGAEVESGMSAEAKEALFKFLLDFGKIRSFFSENRHIRGRSESFYIKEAQVVIDHEGRIERLDTYLQKTPEGRELFDVVYQPVSIPSATKYRNVTIPIAPGFETTLPVPPNCAISALEYLNAHGERIEQPEHHYARVCIAGGVVVKPPLDARIVAYSIVDKPTRSYTHDGGYPGARALTPEEFEKLRSALPRIGFDLGEEMEIAYSMIRMVGNPELRAPLAAYLETERTWIYTMDSMVREFQRAAGSAFLESVYHMRAGICDSMSAVGAHLLGSAIGLPGIVVSGPVQDKGYFDLRTGHSISEALLPDATTTFDITEISTSNGRHTGARVPVHTQAALSKALSTPQVTRREVATIYQDLGDLIRGTQPQRYTAHPDPSQKPRSTWRDRFISAEVNLANKNRDNTPKSNEYSTERAVVYGTAMTLLDRIAQRTTVRGDASELCWFIRERVSSLPAAPFIAPGTAKNLGLHRDLIALVNRDIYDEANRHLITAIRTHTLPSHEVARLPESVKSFTFKHSLEIAEALVATGTNLETAAAIVRKISAKMAGEFEYEVQRTRIDGAVAVCDRMSSIVRALHATDHLVNSREVARTLGPLLAVSRFSFKIKMAAEDTSRCARSLIYLISSAWTAGGFYSANQLCMKIAENDTAREGFDLVWRHAPTELRRALLADTPQGSQALTSAFVRYLSTSTASVMSSLHLVKRLEGVVDRFDLSSHGAEVHDATRGLIRRYTENYRGRFLSDNRVPINWPGDEHPGSSLVYMSAPAAYGGIGVTFLKACARLHAFTESEARALWPQQDELQVIRAFMSSTALCRGGVIGTRERYRWKLGAMPDVLMTISETSKDPSIPATMRELIEWQNGEKEPAHLPEERHFKRMIEMLGGVPAAWDADSHSNALAEAIATFIQGSLTDQEIYTALHAVGPRVIMPKDEALDPEFTTHLDTFARSMRGTSSTAEAIELLQSAHTFTRRRPVEGVPEMPGIAAACSIIDMAHKLGAPKDLLVSTASAGTPRSHVAMIRRDDGTLPDGQIWRNAVSVPADSPAPDLKDVMAEVKRLREAFSSLPLSARQRLRSPLYQYTSSELGRVKIVGNSGSPEAARAYQPGDSRREINWRISARDGQDQLWMKVREEREERSLTLVVDLENLFDELPRTTTKGTRSARTIIEQAPTLATIIHETMVAQAAGLKVDILFTHHTVILSKKDATDFILNPSKDGESREFWESVLRLGRRASARRFEEREVFGPKGYDTGSPLKYGEVPLRRNSLVEFLLGPDSAREGERTVRALKARGHLVSCGVLPGLRRGGGKTQE
jgi:hypothetical protein